MQAAPSTEKAPNEKSQIHIQWSAADQPPTILRFSSVKKGEKAYAALTKAWATWATPPRGRPTPRFHSVDGDMFVSTIDLAYVMCLSFVDHSKRAKFIAV